MRFSHDHPFYRAEPELLEAAQRLDELTLDDIKKAIDPNDLPYRDYAPLIKFVRYVETKGNIMKFYVPSNVPHKYPGILNTWNSYIQFVEWYEVLNDRAVNAVEGSRLLLWSGNLRVHCACPAFKFWGHQYIMTQLDAAIVPEIRFPHIRNPALKGLVCKHLRRCLLTLVFHLGDMAKALKQQRETTPSS